MTLTLNFPLTLHLDSPHYGVPRGTPGRGGEEIAAICLHVLENTVEGYLSYLHSDRLEPDVRPGEHGSVHYGVAADGTLHQFVRDEDMAWGVRELSNPTWPLLGDHSGIDPDAYLLHVGVERFLSVHMPALTFRALAELLAVLCVEHSIPADASHIISHDELDVAFPVCAGANATNLIATVATLVSQGNDSPGVNIAVLAAQVTALQAQVDALAADVADSLATISTYAAHVTAVAGASTLGHVKASAALTVNPSTGVAAPAQLAAACAVNPASPQTIAPNIEAVVTFPTVSSDPLAWVTPGAFQVFTPTVAGLYRLRARVGFAAAAWSAGSQITLTCYKSGLLLGTLAVVTVAGALTGELVEAQGEYAFAAAVLTDTYDVRVLTDDPNGAKSITSGAALLEKVGA